MNASNDLLLTLAWSLLHFIWQGAIIAALAAACMFAFRKPATRYLIGMGALALMFISFGVTFGLLNGTAAGSAESAAARAPAAAFAVPLQMVAGSDTSVTHAHTEFASQREFLWLAQGWLAGVFVLALRLAFGLLVIEYLRRRNLIALPDTLVARFRALQQRLGVQRLIRYRECAQISAPAVIGFFRPIVLIPMRALTGLSPEQLEAVIAHELGHIKRFDVAVNFFQVIAETLFFFHPAVWWLNKRIRADREDCCDDIAVNAAGGRLGYAKALATMATWRNTPRFAMAATGGPLAARVARLLGADEHRHARMSGVVTFSLVIATAALASAISFGLVNPATAQTAPAAAPTAFPASAPEAAPAAKPAPAARPAPAAKAAPAANPAPAAPAAPPAKARPATELTYLEALRNSGIEFDVDQLVSLKIHGVTPEYISEMRATGLEVDADTLIAMKVQDVSPEFVSKVRAQGFNPSVDDVVAFAVHDVSADYVNSLRSLGVEPDVDQVVALATHDVSADYVRQMREAGFAPTTEDLIAMKIHDVTPEYRKAWEANGFKLSIDQLVAARIHDLSPEFIEKVGAHGFGKLSFDQLIQLKIADVL
jgi:beta-lactamase regulating signal transducer with metallopeptidase domain